MKKLPWIAISLLLLSYSPTLQASDDHNLCLFDPPPYQNVSIPADDGIHLEPDGTYTHQYEQWYWTAFVTGRHGKTYALQTLVFQFNLFQPLIFDIVQISYTDIETGDHYTDFALNFDAPGYTPVTNGFDIELHDPVTGAGLVAIGGGGRDSLTFNFSDGTVAEIDMNSLKHPTESLDGLKNYLDTVTGESHGEQYYLNRRSMATRGKITFPGERPIRVSGIGHYDRQWGTVIGTPGTQADNVSWKWFALTLFDGTHAPTQGVLPAFATNYVMWDMHANDTGNTLVHRIDKIGPAPLCRQEKIDNWTVEGTGETIFSPGPPPTTIDLVNTISIPSEGLELTVEPLVDDQFVNSGGLFDPFYEGITKVTGTRHGRPVSGYGYYEGFLSCCQGQ